MKKLSFIFLFSFLTLGAFSQGYIAPELGGSTKGTWYTSLKGGYQVNNIFAEGMIMAQMNDKDAAYFGIAGGYAIDLTFISVEPAAGLNYRLISTDKKSLNGFVPGGSVKLKLNNHVYACANYTDETWLFGVGLKCVL